MLEGPDADLIRPVELLFLLCFITDWTCVVVSVILIVCRLCVTYICVCLCCVSYV